MAYKAFPAVTTAYRPNYRKREKSYYARGGNAEYHYRVEGPLLTNPTEATKLAVYAALMDTADYGKGIVQQDTPVDTGLLKSRWYTKHVRWNEWRLSNDIFYGPFNETRVHMLRRNLPNIENKLAERLDVELPRALN